MWNSKKAKKSKDLGWNGTSGSTTSARFAGTEPGMTKEKARKSNKNVVVLIKREKRRRGMLP